MSVSRTRHRIPAALVLGLFLFSLGAVFAHDHPTGPTCQVCKLVHNAPADLVRRTSAPEPLRAVERIAPSPIAGLRHPDLVVPQGRAPPAA